MLTAWHTFAIATLVASFVFVAFMLYWTLEPFGKPVIAIEDNKIAIELNVAKPGDTVYLVYSFCKAGTPQTAKVKRYLKDELVYFLPTLDSNVQPGCQHYRVPLEIPRNLPPDTYTYNAEIEYKVNPIKTETYYFTSDKFIIE